MHLTFRRKESTFTELTWFPRNKQSPSRADVSPPGQFIILPHRKEKKTRTTETICSIWYHRKLWNTFSTFNPISAQLRGSKRVKRSFPRGKHFALWPWPRSTSWDPEEFFSVDPRFLSLIFPDIGFVLYDCLVNQVPTQVRALVIHSGIICKKFAKKNTLSEI